MIDIQTSLLISEKSRIENLETPLPWRNFGAAEIFLKEDNKIAQFRGSLADFCLGYRKCVIRLFFEQANKVSYTDLYSLDSIEIRLVDSSPHLRVVPESGEAIEFKDVNILDLSRRVSQEYLELTRFYKEIFGCAPLIDDKNAYSFYIG